MIRAVAGALRAAAWRRLGFAGASCALLFAVASAGRFPFPDAFAEPVAGEGLDILPAPGSTAPPAADAGPRALPAPSPKGSEPSATPSGASVPAQSPPGSSLRLPADANGPSAATPAAPSANGTAGAAPSSPDSGSAPPAPAAITLPLAIPLDESTGNSTAVRATFVRDVLTAYVLPDSARFTVAAGALETAVEQLCTARDEPALGGARSAWIRALAAWDSLDAIEIGPILDRRSMFQIDFWPARPFTIDIVVRSFPESARTLDVVSAPAKGLPALEYLLWPQSAGVPVLAGANQCAYARLLASGLSSEARALEAGFRELAAKSLDGAQSKALLTQIVNQTFGAVEGLRGKSMLRPASVKDAKLYPRPYSGETVHTWAVRWSAIRRILLGAGGETPSLERHLRDEGRADTADRLRAAVLSSDAAMRETIVADPESALRAAKALAATETSLDRDVAPALRITIGFRGADGD